jgi:hypothetical protein
MDLGPFPTDEALGLLLEHAPDRRRLRKELARRAVEGSLLAGNQNR